MEGTEVGESPFMQGAVQVVQLQHFIGHAGVYAKDVEGGLCKRAQLIVHMGTAHHYVLGQALPTDMAVSYLVGHQSGHSTDHAGTKPLPVCCCRGAEGIC